MGKYDNLDTARLHSLHHIPDNGVLMQVKHRAVRLSVWPVEPFSTVQIGEVGVDWLVFDVLRPRLGPRGKLRLFIG